jgi:hypothetical protein
MTGIEYNMMESQSFLFGNGVAKDITEFNSAKLRIT